MRSPFWSKCSSTQRPSTRSIAFTRSSRSYDAQKQNLQSWDPRALDKYPKYGLRETPTALFPTEAQSGFATLTTTKHQEAWSYARSNFVSIADDHQARLVAPDLDAENATNLFHRPEMDLTVQKLPNVRPNVLWMLGAFSPINTLASQAEKVARTGTGLWDSGGAEQKKWKRQLSRRLSIYYRSKTSRNVPHYSHSGSKSRSRTSRR